MERNPFRHATGVTPPPVGEASPACGDYKLRQRAWVKHVLGGARGQRPLEKPLYYILKIEIPLPRQRSPLFQKSIGVGGGRGREPEKFSQMKQACRMQQKFNSPKNSSRESISHNAISQHQKPSPRSPPSQTLADSGFFGPNTGQFGSEPGYFGSLLGRFLAFPGQNRTVLGPRFPLPGSPSAPGDVQKLHLPARAHKRTLSTAIPQNRTKYNIIITNSPKFTPLSL